MQLLPMYLLDDRLKQGVLRIETHRKKTQKICYRQGILYNYLLPVTLAKIYLELLKTKSI